MSSMEGQVRELVEPAVAPLGLAVEEVSIRQAGARRLVRISVDVDIAGLEDDTSAVAPLTLDEVADANRAIDDALEATNLLGAAPYTLEVGSPGVSRPLTAPHHYRRNVSRLVKATLADGETVTGRIMRASTGAEGTLDLLVSATRGKNKAPEHMRTLSFAELRSATVQVEFNRPDAVLDLTDLPPDEDDLDDETDETDETDQTDDDDNESEGH